DRGHHLDPRPVVPAWRRRRGGQLRNTRRRSGVAAGLRRPAGGRGAGQGDRHPAAAAHRGGTGTMTALEVHLDEAEHAAALRADAYAGLTATEKWLPPKWFYDARGSALFEEITRLPEYFPTRAEREIL